MTVVHTISVLIVLELYLGSANLDWSSLAQVKEIGCGFFNCPELNADARLVDGFAVSVSLSVCRFFNNIGTPLSGSHFRLLGLHNMTRSTMPKIL